MTRQLSLAEARALALTAQGFGSRDGSAVTEERAMRMLKQIAPLQIDSVNVLVRTQYLPLFSRLGAYDREIIDGLAYRRRALFEYWGHMASYMPVEMFPLMRWKMRLAGASVAWQGIRQLADKHPEYIEDVYNEVKDRGPITASDLSDPGRKTGPWWGRAAGKDALEWLFHCGRVTASDRRNFERVYDLTERVIPARALDAPEPNEHDARAELLLRSARALGVATARDLFDYFRLNAPKTRPVLEELIAARALTPVAVEGWKDRAYTLPRARVPAMPGATALLSPFDSLVWDRARTERLFGFFYRIEIYVPAPKRVHGYYVLPFLMNGELVARADLKADRSSRTLLVHAAFAEPHSDKAAVADALARELRAMAVWLGLDNVKVGRLGDLARALATASKRA
ncbi:MAG: winged helix-turn-helix domain-containing protein [Actinomycetota bacterium]